MAIMFHHTASNIIPMVKQCTAHVIMVYIFVYIAGGRSVGVTEFTINMPESISIQ